MIRPMSTASGSPANKPTTTLIFRIQVIAISIVGAAAVILFIISRFVEGELATSLSNVAGVLGIACAVIGFTFSLTAGRAVK